MTDHPTAAWTARQLLEAFPEDTAPKSLLRDRDERLIGSIRRECLDHVVVLNDAHLRRVRAYLAYYHGVRIHLSLEKDSPEPRPVERLDHGRIVEAPVLGGLHRCHSRLAAQASGCGVDPPHAGGAGRPVRAVRLSLSPPPV